MRAAEILDNLAQHVLVIVAVILAAVSPAAIRCLLIGVRLAAPFALHASRRRGWTDRWNVRRRRKDGMDRVHGRCSAVG
jgi:hypothetical protein